MEHTYRHAKTWLILWLILGFILCFVLVGFIVIIFIVLRYKSESLTLTDKSVVLKRGIIVRYTIELPYSKINNVNTIVTPISALLGYGNIAILSANATDPEVFKAISNTVRIKDQIVARIT